MKNQKQKFSVLLFFLLMILPLSLALAEGEPEPPAAEVALDVKSDNFDQKIKLEKINIKSCKWHNEFPRKIISGPGNGCGVGVAPKTACVGFVVCEKKPKRPGATPVKFIRQSTCSEKFCGDGDEYAVKCTNDRSYWSEEVKVVSKPKKTAELGSDSAGVE